MELVIKQGAFNKLFFRLWKSKDETDIRYIISRGGFGSGKSVATAQYLILRCLRERNFKALIVMKYGNALDKTVIEEFRQQLKAFEIWDKVTENKSSRTITFRNGSVLLFSGMDDPEKIKGVPNIKLIYCEEATNLTLPDFQALDGRLRGKETDKVNRQIILNFNPVSKLNWVYKFFYENGHMDGCLYLKTTYKNNKFLDSAYIKSIERYKNYGDYNEWRIRGLAEWGLVATGGELLPNFSQDKHVSDKAKYDPNKPIIISIDENVNPYISCIVAQLQDDKELHIVDEILMRDPFNTIRDLCNEVINKYSHNQHGIAVYGDATSRAKDIRSEGSLYDMILSRLKSLRPQLRVGKSNPSVSMSSSWLNEIFFDGTPDNLKLVINPKCENIIYDLMVVKKASDNGMFKKKERDPVTGVTMEMTGHLTDATRYLCCGVWAKEYEGYKNGGKVIINTSLFKRENKFSY